MSWQMHWYIWFPCKKSASRTSLSNIRNFLFNLKIKNECYGVSIFKNTFKVKNYMSDFFQIIDQRPNGQPCPDATNLVSLKISKIPVTADWKTDNLGPIQFSVSVFTRIRYHWFHRVVECGNHQDRSSGSLTNYNSTNYQYNLCTYDCLIAIVHGGVAVKVVCLV